MRKRYVFIISITVLTQFFLIASACAETGRLALDISPEPADVFINDKKYANGSGVFKLESGEHEVVIKKVGYKTETLNVFVGPDALITKTIALEKLPTKEEIEERKRLEKLKEEKRKAEEKARKVKESKVKEKQAAEKAREKEEKRKFSKIDNWFIGTHQPTIKIELTCPTQNNAKISNLTLAGQIQSIEPTHKLKIR